MSDTAHTWDTRLLLFSFIINQKKIENFAPNNENFQLIEDFHIHI